MRRNRRHVEGRRTVGARKPAGSRESPRAVEQTHSSTALTALHSHHSRRRLPKRATDQGSRRHPPETATETERPDRSPPHSCRSPQSPTKPAGSGKPLPNQAIAEPHGAGPPRDDSVGDTRAPDRAAPACQSPAATKRLPDRNLIGDGLVDKPVRAAWRRYGAHPNDPHAHVSPRAPVALSSNPARLAVLGRRLRRNDAMVQGGLHAVCTLAARTCVPYALTRLRDG